MPTISLKLASDLPSWSLHLDAGARRLDAGAAREQAKARINRIGQTKQTLVIRLMTPGTVEEKMLR